jgi:hypothetical protein
MVVDMVDQPKKSPLTYVVDNPVLVCFVDGTLVTRPGHWAVGWRIESVFGNAG